MKWQIITNCLEAILLSWFISSLLDLKKNIWLFRIVLFVISFSITTFSNYLNTYDMLLSTAVIFGSSIISLYFTKNHYSEILFICCLESLLLCISISSSILLLSQVNIEFVPIICRVIYLMFGYVMIYMLRKENLGFDKKVYYSLTIIIYLVHFLVQYLLQIYLIIQVKTFDFLVSFGLLIICMFILFYVIVYISKLYKNKEEYDKLLKEKQSEIVLTNLYNEVKIAKHDLKHDFNLLQYYMDNNDIENIKQIIKQKNNQVDDIPSLICSKNNIINTVINNKIIEAYSKQIKVQCKIVVGAVLSITDYDINQLLSNILDNAIENCANNGEIDIQILQEQDFLHIQVSNSIERSAIKQGMKTKKDKRYHGFGLKSIKNICQKYNATVNIREENEMFFIEASLVL